MTYIRNAFCIMRPLWRDTKGETKSKEANGFCKSKRDKEESGKKEWVRGGKKDTNGREKERVRGGEKDRQEREGEKKWEIRIDN